MVIILCIIIIIILINGNNTLIDASTYGLMLWYKNIVPMLLPFMLISELLVRKTKSLNPKYAPIISILLGLMCGFPVGAKTIAYYNSQNIISDKTANCIMVLCNNVSPIFIAGYIVNKILNNKVSFICVLFLIYIPIIIYTLINLLIGRITSNSLDKTIENTSSTDINIIDKTLTQLLHIGVYICLCSIAAEFINQLTIIPASLKPFIFALVEITRGTNEINRSLLCENKKIALILAFTVFGGISSILQIYDMLQKSKLSIIRYVIGKGICAIATYYLTLLFI